MIIGMFGSAFVFYFFNKAKGITHDFTIDLGFLPLLFDKHYKSVWVINICMAVFIALLLNKHWACKNMCPREALCAVGARHSLLLAVVNIDKCICCSKCEKKYLNDIYIMEYVKKNTSFVSDFECIMCGICMSIYKFDAIECELIWNRKNSIFNHK